MIIASIKTFGRYCIFMSQVVSLPHKLKVFFKNLLFEINKLGVD